MVVAEVPLWVVHDSGLIADDAGTTTTSSIVRHHHSTNPEERAYQTLDFLLSPSSSVLQSSTNNNKGNHKKKKCAVYSLDIHPDGTKFATAGGDGTVRIWNMEALFYNPAAANNNKTQTTKNDTRVAKFDDGAYVSTDYSSSETDDTDDGEPRNNGNHKKSTNHKNRPKDDDDDDAMSTSSSSSGQLLSPLVHDLNSVVRRKKSKNETTTGMNESSSSRTTEQPASSSLVSEKETAVAAAAPSATAAGGDTKNSDKSTNHHHHHRLLCTLSAHTGSSVLIVRFSNSGKYLASAADDACVCIYAPSLYSTNVGNLTSAASNVEHWTRIRLLRGHTLDVVDLTWSPDDTYLVSCSLDSETPIAVWSVRDLGSIDSTSSKVFVKPYRILGVNVHTSTVKGVSFDPAGSYLASSGDDPAVCIWRTDDWGLEKRIDSQDGIFRTWANNDELSNQSLFRRISWSADGSFVCSTNSVVKNKHVLSTITREGWKAGEQSANLIGHKQPIVVCRNSLHLLSNKTSADQSKEEEDDDPDYATLLAIGDRRGFVTVWSTKKSRPLFKLQCSETRCTVTDLAWGRRTNDGDLILLVSLLDGQVTALKFGVPDELGHVLTPKQKARVFQLRYGIEMTTDGHGGAWSHKQLFAGAGGRSAKLIENAIQLSLEDQQNEDNNDDDDEVKDNRTRQPEAEEDHTKLLSVKQTQEESMSKSGKKRIRPVLLTQVAETSSKTDVMSPTKKQQKPIDPLQNAIDVADRAAETAVRMEKIRTKNGGGSGDVGGVKETDDRAGVASPPPRTPHSRHMSAHALVSSVVAIPHSTDRSHTADLPFSDAHVPDGNVVASEKSVLIAECSNSVKVPIGSRGIAIPCADVSIVKNGRVVWKDQIVGASCSAISASKYLLAVGFVDGSIQLYGTSQTIGWSCGTGFRSHPPLILLNGHPIVTLQLREHKQLDKGDASGVDLLVVSADGSFGVYTILPEFGLSYKGSVMTAMTHMAASSPSMLDHHRLPKLSRMYITETGRLVLMLSLQQQGSASSPSRSGASGPVDVGAGGSLQAFLYERKLESWMRISDSRFLLSDYYSVLPAISDKGRTDSTDMGSTDSTMRSGSLNVLRQIDDTIRLGSLHSTLKKASSHYSQQGSRRGGDLGSLLLYSNDMEDEDDYVNFVATRSHCEDRMSCALALGSVDEFKHWLTLYVKVLVRASHGAQLRTLTDMLLGKIGDTATTNITNNQQNARCSWWLDDASTLLGLNRKSVIQSIIIPEMSRNRALQQITNEIALEIDSLE